MLEETFDVAGNHVLYEYAAEPATLELNAPFETKRHYASQRYPRRILYGNVPDSSPGGADRPWRTTTDHDDRFGTRRRSYVFEVVFDYGVAKSLPQPGSGTPFPVDIPTYLLPPQEGIQETADATWALRPDPFSSYRAGFEIRTLRRCRRVVMFHHFTAAVGISQARTPAKATEFEYTSDPGNALSMLAAVRVCGYRHDTNAGKWFTSALPPVTFRYSEFQPEKQRYKSLQARGGNMPGFTTRQPAVAVVDLQGDGLPDLLDTAMGDGSWRYWRNLGGGQLDMPHPQHAQPAGRSLAQPGVTLGDLGGDGLADLIVESPIPGMHEATSSGEWRSFRAFGKWPSFPIADPSIRLLDLTGDGRPDALMTGEHCFLWFECLGEEGYTLARSVPRVHDLAEFPDVSFADPSGRVRIADMNGDGLPDIVLLHDGRVDYWPSLGHGRFGSRITMAQSPRIGPEFNPQRVFLADLDGSGCTDLVYVGFDRVRFWFNRSGNSWSDERVIEGTPFATDATALLFADIFGNGTATLLWSYDHGTVADGNYKALDFCGGVKPNLLVEMDNNMGATTRVAYVPSTRFYLDDLAKGSPWITSLPFPVHVVEKVEAIDSVSNTKLVTTYAYHHGYFDGHEREFRGFGRVDRFDSEVFENFTGPGLHQSGATFTNDRKSFFVPPVETRTWFHTGVWFDPDREGPGGRPLDHCTLTEHYRAEYYDGDPEAFAIRGHVIDGPVTEPRQAFRALRGAVLRVEVYSNDGTAAASHPYLVTETRHRVQQLQAPGETDEAAVYHATPMESFSYHYERSPSDPRIEQELTLVVDAYGNVTDRASIAYPRRNPAHPEQGRVRSRYTHTDVVNDDTHADYHRVRVACQTRSYEVTGLRWSRGDGPLTSADLASLLDTAITPGTLRAYHDAAAAASTVIEKRILEWTRVYFRRDSAAATLDIAKGPPPSRTLSARLPLGNITRRGLPYESYQAALADAHAALLFDDPGKPPRTAAIDFPAMGYHRESDAPGYWWLPSGQQQFDSAKYLLPVVERDAFGEDRTLVYDDYALSVASITDAVRKVTRAEHDYRVLQPFKVTDPNGAVSQVAFDALGLVTGSAVCGAGGEGDDLTAFQPDLDPAAHLNDPLGQTLAALANASSRSFYDLHRIPAVVYTMAREIHANPAPTPPAATRVQRSFSYSDGFGRVIQTKVQAAPNRWVANGWMILNNKGKPARQYEPFFTTDHHYEPGCTVAEDGTPLVASTVFYDPLERVVGTLYANHTYEKIRFSPWRQEAWDTNDTLHPTHRFDPRQPGAVAPEAFHPKDDPDLGAWFKALDEADYWPTWYFQRKNPVAAAARWTDVGERARELDAATKAAAHAATPAVTHFDELGRPFLGVADNGRDDTGADVFHETHTGLDIQGQALTIVDARGVLAFIHGRSTTDAQGNPLIVPGFDMAGRQLRVESADAGSSLTVFDVTGQPVKTWDANGNLVHIEYDPLRRPLRRWVTPPSGTRFLGQQTDYGESLGAAAPAVHLCGRVWRVRDSAGEVITEAYDFKGNAIRSVRRIADDHAREPDWSQAPPPALKQERYVTRSTFDALSRVVEQTLEITASANATDATYVYRPSYDARGLLSAIDAEVPDVTTSRPYRSRVSTSYVKAIEYNAKGQRHSVRYGNDAETKYTYDPDTFRLRSIVTRDRNSAIKQYLLYAYDPVGNTTRLRDDAFHPVFNRNQEIPPESAYRYDPLYRLIEATGREHEAVSACDYGAGSSPGLIQLTAGQPVSNGQALRNYTETYTYDNAGNLERVTHAAGSRGSWTRTQSYAADSNRLRTSVANDAAPPNAPLCAGESGFAFSHDPNGNLLAMPHLPAMAWDYANRLRQVETSIVTSGTRNRVWCVYGAGGQRVRKLVLRGSEVEETLYVGPLEIRRRGSGTSATEEQCFHVMDGGTRIALVELTTKGPPTYGSTQAPTRTLTRYQCPNHLGSAVLELDETGIEITYEEFLPYGGTAYIAGRWLADAKRKRYRYSGKERDDATGLDYYGARYYAAALGRWIGCDPDNRKLLRNAYEFVNSAPSVLVDVGGKHPINPATHAGTHETITRAALKDAYLGELMDRPYSAGKFEEGLIAGVEYPDIPEGVAKLLLVHEAELRGEGKQYKESLSYRSHYGDLQYWHSMSPPGTNSAEELQSKILTQASDWYDKARRDLETGKERRAGLWMGKILHMVQDSWSPAHVERDEAGRIVGFQGYDKQSPEKHTKAEAPSGVVEAYWPSVQKRVPGANEAKEASHSLLSALLTGDKRRFMEILNKNYQLKNGAYVNATREALKAEEKRPSSARKPAF